MVWVGVMSERELHCSGLAWDIPAVSLVFRLRPPGNLVNLPKVLSFISLTCLYNIVRKFLGRCCSHGVALAPRGVRQRFSILRHQGGNLS